jgi:selenide,water dikinase
MTIILAGSGHAHLEVVKALSKEEISKHRFLLISPHRQTYYSGLIPRLIMGEIEASDLTINSADFAETKGFHFIQDSVRAINQAENTVLLASGREERFDLLSLNIGGTPKRIPTESPQHTINVRPFDDFIPRWREVQSICSANVNPRFVVVGGGAAAVEVATALRVRLNRNQPRKGRALKDEALNNQALKSEVILVSKGIRLCEGYSEQISALLRKSLRDLNIQVRLNEPVNEIFLKHIKLKSGEKVQFDSIFIATPTEPSEIISSQIDSTLRIAANIFAVGDCTTMLDHPELPRSGVIAVQQGRHLVQSLRSYGIGPSSGSDPARNSNPVSNSSPDPNPMDFTIKSKQLNILISGENSAHLIWGRFSFDGNIPLRIKNWIDKRYIKSFLHQLS